MAPVLRATNLSKSFGTLQVLREVNFQIEAGEVLGLVGESGAGKSVLAKVITGRLAPDSGSLEFNGQSPRYPFSACDLRIELIPQKPALIDQFDVASNILLGREPRWHLISKWLDILNKKQAEVAASEVLNKMKVTDLDPRSKTSDLSSEQRQLVSIARAVAQQLRLVVLDDPAHLLSFSHQSQLLDLIQQWQQQGTAVILISNNLDHLFAVADRILVMRHGRVTAELSSARATREEIVSALVGMTDQEHLTPIVWALKSYYRTRERAARLRQQMVGLEMQVSNLDTHNQQLVDQLAEQVNLLDALNLQLQDAHRRLLIEREEERKSLARELHDETIQSLLSLNYDLEDIVSNTMISTQSVARIMDIRDGIKVVIDDLRFICSDLRPPTFDSLGLAAALRSLVTDWSTRSEIKTTLSIQTGLESLPEELQLSIFRIVQEALNNVRKHSKAERVRLVLERSSPRLLLLTIADDGKGMRKHIDIPSLAAEGHYGLLGINERVELVGGQFRIWNQSQGGLALQIEIPHDRLESDLNTRM